MPASVTRTAGKGHNMALAVTIRYGVKDETNKSSFVEIQVPTGISLANLVLFAEDMAQLVLDCLQGRIDSITIQISLDLSGATLKAVANTVSFVAEKAHYIFATAVAGFTRLFKVPARVEADEVPNSDNMLQSDPGQAAFIAGVLNGMVTAGGTINFLDDYMQPLQSVVSAKSVHFSTAA